MTEALREIREAVVLLEAKLIFRRRGRHTFLPTSKQMGEAILSSKEKASRVLTTAIAKGTVFLPDCDFSSLGARMQSSAITKRILNYDT